MSHTHTHTHTATSTWSRRLDAVKTRVNKRERNCTTLLVPMKRATRAGPASRRPRHHDVLSVRVYF